MTTIEFRAPWSASLRSMTVTRLTLLAVILTGVILARAPTIAIVVMFGGATLAVGGALAVRVRGYTLTEDAIIVHRGFWDTRLPLTGLRCVTGEVDAVGVWVKSYGLFSFTGIFWSRKLSWYRAYATDLSRAVVLRYPKRTIVITPHDPQQFIMRARTFLKVAEFPK